jgi:uncharacterized caspase-like protein
MLTTVGDTLKQAKETDTVLLFIAGHGSNDGPDYRFLANNAERLGDTFRGATVVPWHALQAAIEGAKGRRILFIDTCHSGNAYNQQLGNAAYHANIIAYSAARFDQEALEDRKLGHGSSRTRWSRASKAREGFRPRSKFRRKSLRTTWQSAWASWRRRSGKSRRRSTSRGAMLRITSWRADKETPIVSGPTRLGDGYRA